VLLLAFAYAALAALTLYSEVGDSEDRNDTLIVVLVATLPFAIAAISYLLSRPIASAFAAGQASGSSTPDFPTRSCLVAVGILTILFVIGAVIMIWAFVDCPAGESCLP
jgi:hypothetical protein